MPYYSYVLVGVASLHRPPPTHPFYTSASTIMSSKFHKLQSKATVATRKGRHGHRPLFFGDPKPQKKRPLCPYLPFRFAPCPLRCRGVSFVRAVVVSPFRGLPSAALRSGAAQGLHVHLLTKKRFIPPRASTLLLAGLMAFGKRILRTRDMIFEH